MFSYLFTSTCPFAFFQGGKLCSQDCEIAFIDSLSVKAVYFNESFEELAEMLNRMDFHNRHVPFASFFLLLFLLSLLLYSSAIWGGEALYFRDIYHNYYPFLEFMKQSLWQGELPFWNPFLFSGTPQMAALEPPLFYPFAWIFFTTLSFQSALVFNLIGHHLLAATGFYLLGRSYGWSWLSRFFAAVIFTLSGVFVSLHNFHPLQNTVAWLPLIWWAFDRVIFESKRSKACLLFALFYALQILSGHLEIVYFETLLLCLYLFWVFRYAYVFRFQVILSVLGSFALGILLSALQLLPSLLYVPFSIRMGGIASQAQIWSYHPALSFNILLPDYVNQTLQGISLHAIFGDSALNYTPFYLSVYFGLGTFLTLMSGFWGIKKTFEKGIFLFFIGMALFALGISWGEYFPFYKVISCLPGFSFFRFPSKFMVFVFFFLVIAASFAFDALIKNRMIQNKFILFSFVFSFFLFFCLGLSFFASDFVFSQLNVWLNDVRPDFELAARPAWISLLLQQLRGSLFWAAILALVFSIWNFVYTKKAINKSFMICLFLCVNCLDLFMSARASLPFSQAEGFEKPSPLAQQLFDFGLDKEQNYRLINAASHEFALPTRFRVDLGNRSGLRSSLYHHDSLQDNFSLSYGFYNAYGLWPGRSFASDFMSRMYVYALDSHHEDFRAIYESLQSVRYVLTLQPTPELLKYYSSGSNYQKIKEYSDLGVTLWENKQTLPRARFQYQSMVIKDEKWIALALSEPNTSGFDFHKQLVLSENQSLVKALELVPSQEAQQKQWTQPKIVRERNNELEISFKTNTSGYLVLADQNLPGWRVWDNQQEMPVLTANYFQRAVRVGPGEHQIKFRYEPPGFFMGSMLSLLAFILWMALWFWNEYGVDPARASRGTSYHDPHSAYTVQNDANAEE